jgi:hypothetical protein
MPSSAAARRPCSRVRPWQTARARDATSMAALAARNRPLTLTWRMAMREAAQARAMALQEAAPGTDEGGQCDAVEEINAAATLDRRQRRMAGSELRGRRHGAGRSFRACRHGARRPCAATGGGTADVGARRLGDSIQRWVAGHGDVDLVAGHHGSAQNGGVLCLSNQWLVVEGRRPPCPRLRSVATAPVSRR